MRAPGPPRASRQSPASRPKQSVRRLLLLSRSQLEHLSLHHYPLQGVLHQYAAERQGEGGKERRWKEGEEMRDHVNLQDDHDVISGHLAALTIRYCMHYSYQNTVPLLCLV